MIHPSIEPQVMFTKRVELGGEVREVKVLEPVEKAVERFKREERAVVARMLAERGRRCTPTT